MLLWNKLVLGRLSQKSFQAAWSSTNNANNFPLISRTLTHLFFPLRFNSSMIATLVSRMILWNRIQVLVVPTLPIKSSLILWLLNYVVVREPKSSKLWTLLRPFQKKQKQISSLDQKIFNNYNKFAIVRNLGSSFEHWKSAQNIC